MMCFLDLEKSIYGRFCDELLRFLEKIDTSGYSFISQFELFSFVIVIIAP